MGKIYGNGKERLKKMSKSVQKRATVEKRMDVFSISDKADIKRMREEEKW